MKDRPRIWHPEVHERFRENLFYYWLRVRPYRDQDFHNGLRKYLRQQSLSGFCIYPIYGTYDVLLRIWIPPGPESSFAMHLPGELPCIRQVRTFRVTEIARYWIWESQPDAKHEKYLEQITSELVRDVQDGDSEKLNWARNCGLVQPLPKHYPSNSYIKFFTAIQLPQGIGHEAQKDLIAGIVNDLSTREQQELLARSSVYLGYGFMSILIKSETQTFYNIWPLVEKLSDSLSLLEGSTITHIVVKPAPIEGDHISEAAFLDMRAVDLAVNAVLPQLYDEDRALTYDKRQEIEQWVRKHVVAQGLSHENLRDIQNCLIGVIEQREELIVSGLMLVFSRSENYLRKNRGKFIAKTLGPKAEAVVLEESGIKTDKSMKFLSLGDLLNIYSCVLKKQPTLSSAARELLGGWQKATNLRNRVAHGEIDCLKEWASVLEASVNFLINYQKLSNIIEEVLADTRR